MFVSRKKLKALVDESVTVKKENARLRREIQRLSDSNLDLWWDNKMLRLSLCSKQRQKCGEYFYTRGQKR